jgi:hypothetical protein
VGLADAIIIWSRYVYFHALVCVYALVSTFYLAANIIGPASKRAHQLWLGCLSGVSGPAGYIHGYLFFWMRRYVLYRLLDWDSLCLGATCCAYIMLCVYEKLTLGLNSPGPPGYRLLYPGAGRWSRGYDGTLGATTSWKWNGELAFAWEQLNICYISRPCSGLASSMPSQEALQCQLPREATRL